MSELDFAVEYQTLTGTRRRKEYKLIPGSTHWNLTTYEKDGDEWEQVGSTEVKHVETSNVG